MGMEQSISGPALGIPVQIIDEQLRRAVIGCVIRMSNNEVIIDILMSGTFHTAFPLSIIVPPPFNMLVPFLSTYGPVMLVERP